MTTSLGPYVLGALERDERARVEAHLHDCPVCGAELERLAPLPGLLSRLSTREMESLVRGGEDDTRATERMLAVASGARRTRRRAIAAAVAVALVGATVLVATLGPGAGGGPAPPPPAAARTVSASDARTGAAASIRFFRRPWGTRIGMRLRGARPGERCRLFVRGADGAVEEASSWTASYGGRAEVPGSVAIPPDQIRALRVVGAGGRQLLRVPLQVRD